LVSTYKSTRRYNPEQHRYYNLSEQKGKRPFGKHRYRWEDNIKMDLKEVVCEDLDRIHMAQDVDQWRAAVNTTSLINHQVS
jgi:hypothetical protein